MRNRLDLAPNWDKKYNGEEIQECVVLARVQSCVPANVSAGQCISWDNSPSKWMCTNFLWEIINQEIPEDQNHKCLQDQTHNLSLNNNECLTGRQMYKHVSIKPPSSQTIALRKRPFSHSVITPTKIPHTSDITVSGLEWRCVWNEEIPKVVLTKRSGTVHASLPQAVGLSGFYFCGRVMVQHHWLVREFGSLERHTSLWKTLPQWDSELLWGRLITWLCSLKALVVYIRRFCLAMFFTIRHAVKLPATLPKWTLPFIFHTSPWDYSTLSIPTKPQLLTNSCFQKFLPFPPYFSACLSPSKLKERSSLTQNDVAIVGQTRNIPIDWHWKLGLQGSHVQRRDLGEGIGQEVSDLADWLIN